MCVCGYIWASQVALVVKSPPADAEDTKDARSMPGSGRSPEKEMGACSSILAWKIPWTEENGRLQTMGLLSQTWLSNQAHTHTPGYINIFMRSMLQKVCPTKAFFLRGGLWVTHPWGLFCQRFHFHEDFTYKMQLIYKVQFLTSTFFSFTFF